MTYKNLTLVIASALILTTGPLFLSSCYRMPQEGECSVIPSTNNPFIYGGEKGGSSLVPRSSF